MQSSHRPVIFWLLSGCFLIYLMVVAGGITRLTESGLSMVEWSPTGSLPPMNEQEWMEQFEKYQQSPEYKILNQHFTLDDFKSIFWWEYIHRFLGRLIGVVFIIPFLWFWIKKKLPQGFLKKAIILFALGAFQGYLGWWMVESGLVKNPFVSHYRLAAHLITAFATFGFTFWFALDLIYYSKNENAVSFLKKLSVLLLSVVVLQIIYGAFVAGLKAGYGYPTFPKMGDEWFPDDIVSLEPVWKNFLEGHAGVQFVHRYLAYVIVIITGIIFFRARKMNLTSGQKKIINAIGIIVLAQFILGVLTLLYGIPIVIAVLHQVGAFFLFATTLLLIHRTK